MTSRCLPLLVLAASLGSLIPFDAVSIASAAALPPVPCRSEVVAADAYAHISDFVVLDDGSVVAVGAIRTC